jgi:hypothetical protein
MEEARWLTCTDPAAMLRFLRNVGVMCYECGNTRTDPTTGGPCLYCSSDWQRERVSLRKIRLFACACCRAIWPLITGDPGRQAVVVAERFADGQATLDDLRKVRLASTSPVATAAADDQAWVAGERTAAAAIEWQASGDAVVHQAVEEAVRNAVARGLGGAARREVRRRAEVQARRELQKACVQNRQRQCDLLRDLFGNLFRPVSLPSALLRWEDGTLVKLALGIYADRRFLDLPILADALEEAGCQESALLAHCRSGGEHARGCWAVDSLLNKA